MFSSMLRDSLTPLRHRALALPLLVVLELLAPRAHAETAAIDTFANLSLEELADVKITSVSKMPERLGSAAASVYVITANDIRRAGVATLPEALRLAPNLQVARLDARNYAVTARGFNSPFENKLLVLIDGRTVYTPLFSGVFWDAQDVVLEDIARIEVISGPGATLWGANAVNGVINIITRNARDTQGAFATAGVQQGLHAGAVRYGGALAGGAWRSYFKTVRADDTFTASGKNTMTGWERQQAGFRVDLTGLTVQGDAYQGALGQAGTRDIDIGGANVLARYKRTLAPGSELRIEAYVDHTERDQPKAFVERLNTLDVDLQHTLALGATQQLVWGGGYRVAYDRVQNGVNFGFLPGSTDLRWSNLFAQDTISLSPSLRLTAGLKGERNSYTGKEFLPSASLAWQATPGQMLWASAARAVRVPSRIDRDFYSPTTARIVGGVPAFNIAGGPDFAAEVAKVAQLGYRAQMAALSLACTAYASDYDRLRTLEPNPAGAGMVFLNRAQGRSHGLEMSANWDVRRNWRIMAGATVQHLSVGADPGSADATGASALANNDPSSWSLLRSSFDLSDALELDMTMRHVGALPKPSVPAYTALDLRLGWKIDRRLELSLAAQNLLAAGHVEFGAPAGRSVYERTLFGRLTWRL
jgi:iron complex outermembrane recepter protein